MSDEFRTLMGAQGVKPLAMEKATVVKTQPTPPRIDASPVPAEQSSPYAWKDGAGGKTLLERAIDRARSEESFYGNKAQLMLIRRSIGKLSDGGGYLGQMGAEALLKMADRDKVEMIVIAGRGWKLVMHPLLGAAAFTDDAADTL